MTASKLFDPAASAFSQLGLRDEIARAVHEQNYDQPSPIQSQAIPAVLEGRDVMAAAQTGTGKTAGFTLPILERLAGGTRPKANHARALVLTPTRELAAQVGNSVATYSEYLPMKSTIVYGGVKINPQMMRLRQGVDVLVATPGRLLDLYEQNAVKFNQLEVLVLDEADRMLDMGFIHDLRKILKLLPKKRQNLMFSATFSAPIRQLAKTIVHDPIEISVTPANSTANTVEQWVCPVDKKAKPKVLTALMQENKWRQVLVFTKTKHGANRLTRHLEAEGFQAAAIHGNKSQGARTRALEQFKQGQIQVLVATDIAARGLDIDQLPHVVNFELPNVAEDYVHRIGRTGRAGASGEAISLVEADELELLWGIESLIGKFIPRKVLEGFEPVKPLPESTLKAPKKLKKPKKPKKPKVKDSQANGDDQQKKKPSRKSAEQNTKNKSGGSDSKPQSKPKQKSKLKKQSGNTATSENPWTKKSSGNSAKPKKRPASPHKRSPKAE